MKLLCSFSDNCPEGESLCADGETCVLDNYRCDYIVDCPDNSDEIVGCPFCEVTEFQCKSGSCLNATWICDGVPDCFDGSDEAAELCGYTTVAPTGRHLSFSWTFSRLTCNCDLPWPMWLISPSGKAYNWLLIEGFHFMFKVYSNTYLKDNCWMIADSSGHIYKDWFKSGYKASLNNKSRNK